MTVIPNPMRVRPSGVSPTRPMASAIGSKTFLKRARESFEIVMRSGG